MAETGGKKGKKKKGKTLNLNEFLANGNDAQKSSAVSHAAAMYSNRSTSWADESEDLNAQVDTAWPNDYSSSAETRMRAAMDRAALPTAPRAARGPDVDESKLPKEPPFTAFLGNLPYDVDKEDIFQFFHGIDVTEVRLPHDQGGGRPKGFGYAEFEDLQSLLSALALNNEQLKNRRVRVDIAGHQQQGDREGGDRMGRDGRDPGPDRTIGDWRSGPESPPPSSRSGPPGHYGDQNGDKGFDRDMGDRGNDDRDRGQDRDQGFDRDRGSDRDRGYDRDRGFDRNRGYDRDQGFNRDRGSDDRYGGGRDQGYGDERGGKGFGSGWGGGGGGGDRYDDRGPRDRYGDDWRGGDRYGDARRGGDRYGDRDSYDRDRGYDGRYGDRDMRGDYGSRGGRDRDRGGYGDRDRGGFDSAESWRDGDRPDPPRPSPPQNDLRNGPARDSQRDYERIERDQPKERPRLQLKPRSKAAGDEDQKQASSSAIFGNAKPVDTAAREKEVEERISREKAEAERKLQQERDERERSRESRGSRSRRDSNRSSDGERGSTRERLDSSGSGVSHGRRERSGSTKSTVDEKHAGKEPVSPGPYKGVPKEALKEPTSPGAPKLGTKESPKAAPPPPENIWTKRMEAQKAAATKQENEKAEDESTAASSSVVVEKEKSNNSGPPPSPTRGGFGKTAPVERDGQENVPRGRGRGRGEQPPTSDGPGRDRANERREPEKSKKKDRKPQEPKVYEEASQPVFHKESKFSALLATDEDDHSGDEETAEAPEEQQTN